MDRFQPFISIVIPVYNGEDFLAEAIDSALAQTYPNFEVVVVNDGSTDGGATERVALSYGDKIRYFSKPNGGVATALNMAIAQMKGEYASWLSHDDLYTPEKLERQVRFLETLPVAERARTIVYSDYSIFTTDPEQAVPVVIAPHRPEAFRFGITVASGVHGCTFLIPKAAFDEVGLFDPTLRTTQDYDLWFKMATRYAFRHISGYMVKARSHDNQGTVTMSALAQRECDVLLKRFAAELTEAEIQSVVGQPLAVGYARMAQSFWSRGFTEAAMLATRKMGVYLPKATPREMLKAALLMLKGFLQYVVMRRVRPHVSPYVRQQIFVSLRKVWRMLPESVRNKVRPCVNSAIPPHPDSVRDLPLTEKFSRVYHDNIFRGAESRSGEGSDLLQTQVIRQAIPALVAELGVKRFIDAPCGDWYWMRHTALPVEQYIGLDIVGDMIAKHQQQFGREGVAFQVANLAETPLPAGDMIFSRDCLVHLSFADTLKIIANFKRSGAMYLLTTTFTERTENKDLGTGFWRPLNMELAPFHFPAPLRLINEECLEEQGQFKDKCLGLWRLADIPMPG